MNTYSTPNHNISTTQPQIPISANSGFPCNTSGAIQACGHNLNGHMVEGAFTGAIVGGVDGAGIGALPGAALGGFSAGIGGCAGNLYDHFSGCSRN